MNFYCVGLCAHSSLHTCLSMCTSLVSVHTPAYAQLPESTFTCSWVPICYHPSLFSSYVLSPSLLHRASLGKLSLTVLPNSQPAPLASSTQVGAPQRGIEPWASASAAEQPEDRWTLLLPSMVTVAWSQHHLNARRWQPLSCPHHRLQLLPGVSVIGDPNEHRG